MALKKGLDPRMANFTMLLQTWRKMGISPSTQPDLWAKLYMYYLGGKSMEEKEKAAAELLERIKKEGIEAIIAETEQKADDTSK